jgi:hypothetical protein
MNMMTEALPELSTGFELVTAGVGLVAVTDGLVLVLASSPPPQAEILRLETISKAAIAEDKIFFFNARPLSLIILFLIGNR